MPTGMQSDLAGKLPRKPAFRRSNGWRRADPAGELCAVWPNLDATKIPRSATKISPPSWLEFFHGKTTRLRMKAKIIITPKKAVLDPQGKTVQTALAHMGYTGVTGVHIGKYIEIDLAPGTDKAAATKALNDAAHKLLSNPVIEDYKLEIE
jgi:phosphoribosylformylglycinamidine synthase PurS subunit